MQGKPLIPLPSRPENGALPPAGFRENCLLPMHEDARIGRAMAKLIRLGDYKATRRPVYFTQRELQKLLCEYARRVQRGEWRDYAIDTLREKAVFSVFRRSSEMPLYRIEKTPRLARRQGAYSVIAATGLILKRGHDLARVLRALDKGLRLVEA